MKLTYETTAQLNPDQLFEIIKEYVEKKTGKMLCNIYWNESDAGTSAKLVFRDETVEYMHTIENPDAAHPCFN